MIYVSGFIRPEIFPTNFCISVRRSFFSRKCVCSCSSRQNARITRTPVRFSRVSPSTLSRAPCTRRYSGMVQIIMPNTTTESIGIATTKIIAAFTSTVNAIIIAPNTMNGERRNRRSTRFTPDCTWLISLVILVISVDVPRLSISV